MKFLKPMMIGLSVLLCLNACTNVQTQSEVRGFGPLDTRGNIVLLSNLDGMQDLDDDDVDDCIGSAMHHANPPLNLIPAKQFRENLYPYFMPSTTPQTLESFKEILEKPEIEQRVVALKIRYLIILVKSGTVTDWHGGIFCGAGYGGGGCLGLSWWDRKSDLGFAIWDLKTKTLAGNVQARAAGKGIMPAFILPIPVYVPATKSAVCKEIGFRLAKLLSERQ